MQLLLKIVTCVQELNKTLHSDGVRDLGRTMGIDRPYDFCIDSGDVLESRVTWEGHWVVVGS